MLVRRGRPTFYTLGPLVFLLVMTLFALLIQLKSFYDKQDWFLLGLDVVGCDRKFARLHRLRARVVRPSLPRGATATHFHDPTALQKRQD